MSLTVVNSVWREKRRMNRWLPVGSPCAGEMDLHVGQAGETQEFDRGVDLRAPVGDFEGGVWAATA